MKASIIHRALFGQIKPSIRFCLLVVLLLGLARQTQAQNSSPVRVMPSGMPPGMNLPGGGPPSSSPDSGGGNSGGGPWIPSEPPTSVGSSTNGESGLMNSTNEIQLSFQGANIDMVAQWLAQTTGKAVIKHPRVQCQLTIISSHKVTPREAVNMVYRALGLEGYSAIESGRSILIVPEGQEPKMSPELISGSPTNVPEGRQRLVKVFSLKHIPAADVKDRVRMTLSDKATVDVDERANQIVITDYNDNIRVAGELIDALDTDRPEDVAVRVIPLKNIAADQLAKEMAPLYQRMSGKSGGQNQPTIDVAADDRSNSLIVLSSQSDFAAIENLVSMLDTENAQEKATQTFILKNADAQDVATQLQDLNQTQGQSTARYNYYFSSPEPSETKKLSVVADRRRNAIIVQAPPAQMDSIAKMVAELDEPIADDSLAPKIYPLKYVSATDMEDVLNELFLKKQQQRSYWDLFYGDDSSDSSSSSQDAGRLYGKVRITSEPYSNAIIVTSNSKENLAVVEDVLRQLDQPSQAGENTLRVGLKFAKADTVANSLNILFAKNGSPALHPVAQNAQQNSNASQQQQSQSSTPSQSGFDLEQETKEEGYFPWLGGQPDATRTSDGRSTGGSVSDLVGRVRTVSDQRGNAVLISANVHFFPQILKLVGDLDAPSDQVSIEARIVEVSSDYLDKLGVRWSPNGSQVFTAEDYDNSLLASSSGSYQKGLGGTTTVNTPSSSSAGTVIQTLASLRSGMVGSTLNIDYLVQFLRKNTDATVLGDPSITIDDNETGKLFVGQQVPIPANTLVSSQLGGQSTAITYKDVGVVLEVTPHINSAGDVQLKIHAESSTVVSGETVLGGDVFDTRNFRTEVTAKNGETLVLGGIIQKQVSNTLRKTPLLGSVPGLGWAFKKKDKEAQEVELMVFLCPKIIRSPEDSQTLLQDVNQKSPLLKQWERDAQPKKKP